jgi:putative glycerol-1-phosphate prenyltransferase
MQTEQNNFYKVVTAGNGTGLCVLVDPDRTDAERLSRLASLAVQSNVKCFLVGGSLLLEDRLETVVQQLKTETGLPVGLFPGSSWQVSKQADAVLFLSLISGRNPEYLIGQQVQAAPAVKRMGLPVIPTGYMLVGSGAGNSATAYITQTHPIPDKQEDLALATAWAAEFLGMKMLYLEGGSGSGSPISASLVKTISSRSSLPVICGGGIRKPEDVSALAHSGARLLVIGNILEEDPEILPSLAHALPI